MEAETKNTEEVSYSKTLEQWREDVTHNECLACGRSLEGQKVDAYPHQYGWPVADEAELQWLSIACPNDRCGYESSLWKLGVPRPEFDAVLSKEVES